MSLSPHLRHGTLSIRKFYWDLVDLHHKLRGGRSLGFATSNKSLVTQLMWREYFYTMSTENPYYDKIENNKICLPIPWSKDDHGLTAWKLGKTGFPFIDAAMRQLRQVNKY
jgi:cryptochrome